MHLRTLVLTREYAVHRTASVVKALTLVLGEKAEILEEYDGCIRTVSEEFPVPAVIRLVNKIPSKKRTIRFNRTSVFLRDRGCCQYCGVRLTLKLMTYDHVTPKSRGGRSDFTNIVSSCYPCNLRKGNRTPWEAKMILRTDPIRPEFLPLMHATVDGDYTSIPESWRDYIQDLP